MTHGGTYPKPDRMPPGNDPRGGGPMPDPVNRDPLWMIVLSWVHSKIERFLR